MMEVESMKMKKLLAKSGRKPPTPMTIALILSLSSSHLRYG